MLSNLSIYDLSPKEFVDGLLTESPMRVGAQSFGFEDPDGAAAYVQHLSEDKRRQVIDTWNKINLFRVGNIIYATGRDGLSYFVKYVDEKYGALPGRHCTQIAVWRADVPEIEGLPKYVFWKHIFPIHRTVVTDSRQSMAGERFWFVRIREALLDGLNVYRLNIVSRTCSPIGSIPDYKREVKTAYGEENKHENERLVITDSIIKTSAAPERDQTSSSDTTTSSGMGSPINR
jgi:hypothetical protein